MHVIFFSVRYLVAQRSAGENSRRLHDQMQASASKSQLVLDASLKAAQESAESLRKLSDDISKEADRFVRVVG